VVDGLRSLASVKASVSMAMHRLDTEVTESLRKLQEELTVERRKVEVLHGLVLSREEELSRVTRHFEIARDALLRTCNA